MAIASVQTTGEQSYSAGTTHTLAYSSNVTVGSLLLAFIRENNTVTAVSDDVNGAWTELIDTDNTVIGLNVWYFPNAGAGATTVTVTTSAGATIRYAISEYSGLDATTPIEDSDFANFTTTTTPASGSVATAGVDRLIVGCVAANAGATISPRNGETERQEIDTRLQVQDKAAATAGNYDSQWTFGTTQPGIVVALALKPASTTTKYLKLLAHADAQSKTGVAGVVFAAPSGSDLTGAKIGEFTAQAFEATLEGGEAVLLVDVADFGGSALTTSDTPRVEVRYDDAGTIKGTAIVPATVVEL